MIQKLCVALIFFSLGQVSAQKSEVTAPKEAYIDSIESFQAELNREFGTKETSVLTEKDFKNFKGLEFYPIDSTYRVTANFIRTPDEKPFLMPTTTARMPEYVKYGEAVFSLKGKKFTLSLYQNTDAAFQKKYKNYLFLPFTDYTSGNGSYGGGRFIDMLIPPGDNIVVDFNKAYNPYCAYNPTHSCPIPPEENDLKTFIKAGVKAFGPH